MIWLQNVPHRLILQTLQWMALLWSGGNFGRWSLVEGSWSLETCPWWYLVLVSPIFPFSPSPVYKNVFYPRLPQLWCSAHIHKNKKPWVEPSETMNPNPSSFLRCLLVYFGHSDKMKAYLGISLHIMTGYRELNTHFWKQKQKNIWEWTECLEVSGKRSPSNG